jgi:hypothetical protein
MSEIYEFGLRLLLLLIDLMTLALILGIFYVIGLAVATMARNQPAKWANIAYILIVMGAGIALLRWYPQQVIVSIRIALSEARPEADLLREELQGWLPALPEGLSLSPTAAPLPPEAAAPTLVVAPEATAAPTAAIPPPTAAAEATAAPTVAPPTAAPPTVTPQPTVCTIELHGAPWPCPPTPYVYGRD